MSDMIKTFLLFYKVKFLQLLQGVGLVEQDAVQRAYEELDSTPWGAAIFTEQPRSGATAGSASSGTGSAGADDVFDGQQWFEQQASEWNKMGGIEHIDMFPHRLTPEQAALADAIDELNESNRWD